MALSVPSTQFEELPDELVNPKAMLYRGDKPVFVGHYWMSGKPKIQSTTVACLDYSAGLDGNLIAYRWNQEYELNCSNFIE